MVLDSAAHLAGSGRVRACLFRFAPGTPMMLVGLALMGAVNSLVAIALVVAIFFAGYFIAYEPYRALYPDIFGEEVAGRAQGNQAVWRGLGTGVAAIFSATASYGLYGIALGAGAGAFLLPQMIRGRKSFAGGTFTVSAMLIAALVGAGAMILAKLPWYSLLVLALIPVAVRLPGPEKAPVWLQAVLFSLYGSAIAAVACALAWPWAHQI